MGDLVSALGIQWSALLAQMVNFAILVFILTKFVYKPLIHAIDLRRATISASMDKAKEIDRHKQQIDDDRIAILRKADVEAGELLERAKKEADALRLQVEKEAKVQAAQIIAKGREKLEVERAAMIKEIQTTLAHAVVLSAEKILRREFSKEDQENFEKELKSQLPAMLS